MCAIFWKAANLRFENIRTLLQETINILTHQNNSSFPEKKKYWKWEALHVSLWFLFKIFFALIIYKHLKGNAWDMRIKVLWYPSNVSNNNAEFKPKLEIYELSNNPLPNLINLFNCSQVVTFRQKDRRKNRYTEVMNITGAFLQRLLETQRQ